MPQKFGFCDGDITLTETDYYYNLYLKPTKVFYILIVFDNLINLAYFKDVIFGLTVIAEFLGFYQNCY